MLNEHTIKPEANGKYVINTALPTSLYLPSQQEVSALLGLPDNLRKMIPLIESHTGIKLNVGRSSRAKMHTDGFAKPTLKKLINWFNQLPIPPNNILSFRKKFKANYNAGLWCLGVQDLRQGLRAEPYDNEFKELLNFIEKRANDDYQMLYSYKAKVRKGTINKNDSVAIWLHQLPTWQQTGLIPNEIGSDYSEFAQLHAAGKIETEEQVYKYLPAVIAMRFDFYLSAIANYEIGLVLFSQRRGDEIKLDDFEGIMSPVLKDLAVSDEPCYCFAAMLKQFKNILSANGLELGWRKLASYISIKDVHGSTELIRDRQYNQLKDWRNNTKLPSDEKFRAFIEAAFKPLGNYNIEYILIYAKIARGIDSLISQTYEPFKSEHTLAAIKDMLVRYPRYLEHYKEQISLKQKVTA